MPPNRSNTAPLSCNNPLISRPCQGEVDVIALRKAALSQLSEEEKVKRIADNAAKSKRNLGKASAVRAESSGEEGEADVQGGTFDDY